MNDTFSHIPACLVAGLAWPYSEGLQSFKALYRKAGRRGRRSVRIFSCIFILPALGSDAIGKGEKRRSSQLNSLELQLLVR